MADMIISITESGKHAAEDVTGKGLKYKILGKLYEQGTMSTEELSGELGIGSMRTSMVVNSLIREGKVRED